MSYYDRQEDEEAAAPQRELTLSTLTIVGIFFGLALLCAACFGLGYNLGSKSRNTPVVASGPAAPEAAPVGSSADFSGFKPPASTAMTSHGTPESAGTEPSGSSPASGTTPPAIGAPHLSARQSHQSTTAERDAVRPAPATPAGGEATRTAAAAGTRNPPAPASASGPAAGAIIVQVAAVSHAEDADLLVSALKRKGYAVVSRTSPADHFIHVQVGPFASKPAAEAMRQRLIADGYNAILK